MTMLELVAISVGNSRVHVGHFIGDEINENVDLLHEDMTRMVEVVSKMWKASEKAERRAVVIASVNDEVASRIISMLEDQLGEEVYKVGEDLPIPLPLSLDPEAIPGIDRLLCAAAAWDVIKEACIIVNAGTAITIDFVDGKGVFHGGTIAPGVQMQLDSMTDGTEALPPIDFKRPEGEPFGRNTADAMLRGAYHGARGLTWRVVEEYARSYEAFPLVIATGGDAQALYGDDELINRIIDDLELRGIALTARNALIESAELEE